MPNHDEATLRTPQIDKLRAGDNDAWELFYKKYERRIRGYIARRLASSGWGSREGAEDVWMSLVLKQANAAGIRGDYLPRKLGRQAERPTLGRSVRGFGVCRVSC